MKYINELLALIGLALITYGLVEIFGIPVAALTMGILCLFLALFKPTIEAIRGSYVAQTSDPDSGG